MGKEESLSKINWVHSDVYPEGEYTDAFISIPDKNEFCSKF